MLQGTFDAGSPNAVEMMDDWVTARLPLNYRIFRVCGWYSVVSDTGSLLRVRPTLVLAIEHAWAHYNGTGRTYKRVTDNRLGRRNTSAHERVDGLQDRMSLEEL